MSINRGLSSIVVFILLALFVFAANAAGTSAIVGGTVVDLEGKEPIENAVILVEGERIAAIGAASSVEIPDGAERIDAGDTWLIPGLMNMHVHLGLVLPGKMKAELSDESEAALALRMAMNAREEPAGRRHHHSFDGRSASRRPGPDAGDKQGAGARSAYLQRRPAADDSRRSRVKKEGRKKFSGPDELVKGARTQIAAGAKWIKIAISGGIATDGGGLAEALMMPEEIHAVIDAAHRFGVKVTAHSGSPVATSIAVDYGLDCVEHGYFLDRPTLKKMKEHGTWLVPTIVVSQPATAPFLSVSVPALVPETA